jgi:hypothetical protein
MIDATSAWNKIKGYAGDNFFWEPLPVPQQPAAQQRFEQVLRLTIRVSSARSCVEVRLSEEANVCSSCLEPLFSNKPNANGSYSIANGKEVVAHNDVCAPVHQECLVADFSKNGQERCPNCRVNAQIPNELRGQEQSPALFSLKSYAIAQIQWGIAQGARGLLRLSGAVLYSLFWTAIIAGAAIALNAVVDSDPTRLLIAGPIIGGLAGSAFGAALVGATCHVVFGLGSHLIEKARAMAKVRFKQPGQIAATLLLSGVAAVLAWKVGVLAGTLLTAEWIKLCLPPCDVPSLLESMWKFTMAKGLSVGLTELCVVTLAQIELFEIAAIGWGIFTWGRRAFFEELPRSVRA